VKIYVEALRKKERQDETQFTTKIGGKTSLDPSYFVLQNFHSHSYAPMAYYVETDRSCPPNRVTLGRTLICSHLSL